MKTVTVLSVANGKIVDRFKAYLSIAQIRELEKSSDFVVIEK